MSTCHHWGNDAEDLKTEAYHFNVDVLAMDPQEGANDLTELPAAETQCMYILVWFLVTLGVSTVKTSSPVFFLRFLFHQGFEKRVFFFSRGGKLRFPHGQFLVYFLLLVNLALVDQFGVGVSSNQHKSPSSIGFWALQGMFIRFISHTWIFLPFVCTCVPKFAQQKPTNFF